MKVCTDSCILGAWTKTSEANNILDIGTGTGLLALMLAQKSSALIDAVEIEPDAFEEAKQNFENSPWKKILHITHQSIQDYSNSAKQQYDLIISNPPFFTGQLKSPDEKRNIALHSKYLSFTELTDVIIKLLKPNGQFYLILPPAEFESFKKIADGKKIFLNESLVIRDKSDLPVFRIAGCFSFTYSNIKQKELIIKKDGEYSDEFTELLKEYYLNL